jgi:hypothetical protein
MRGTAPSATRAAPPAAAAAVSGPSPRVEEIAENAKAKIAASAVAQISGHVRMSAASKGLSSRINFILRRIAHVAMLPPVSKGTVTVLRSKNS